MGGFKFISKGLYMSLLKVEAILEGLRVLGAWGRVLSSVVGGEV